MVARVHSELVAWQNGESLAGLTGAQLRDLATEVQTRYAAAYTDPRHIDHAFVSESVRELHEQAAARTAPGDMPL